MTSTVRTQSRTINNGQIGQINDRLATKLRESGLLLDAVQKVLKAPGGAAIDEMVAAFRKHVELEASLIVRHVRVKRSRTQKQALEIPDRKHDIDYNAANAMPRGEGEEVDVHFFKPRKSAYDWRGYLSDTKLAKEYDFVGLKPDPYAQAAVNEADPVFSKDHPNGGHWKDTVGNWCHLEYLYFDGRCVRVRCSDKWVRIYGFHYDGWYFAGVPK